ncbi:MAG: hypothetical protein A3J81_01880 [Nitrospirae bacterium RIFOXYB2_FULL_43_5]|nr:MAG: hypothetical protein A2X54_05530 [Nitrospirae bacterium GWF2_44_13]OGW33463.1 MAG: hypothetical protein A2088_06990 [Nitrospirae bacterium GWD2_44_7]OGW66122.1 MAG: hypothetical protein A2222_09935 [Nitrospirae bacterium RIFOXYA2_FULL_44_9]OGW76575.1 MAG: hypothetical protein A3J81_01880 [Nitrospirae bacterium RIFOXYB2_FULL_43_5]HBG92072.1 hypothetical protein [Nitrospiraceae bacterium]
MLKKYFLLSFTACILMLFYSGTVFGGDYIITKWRPISSKHKRAKLQKREATITIKYQGSGSRLINNSCFKAVFEDDSECDGTYGDFKDTRIDSGRRITRRVYFCENKYKIKEITYTCKDSF